MIKKIKNLINMQEEPKIILLDPSAGGGGPKEPDLRIVGLFADVHEEKIAEIIGRALNSTYQHMVEMQMICLLCMM